MNKALHTDLAECSNTVVEMPAPQAPLSECVANALKAYFNALEGVPASNLYEMLMTEVEVPLLRATLEHTNGNQCRASEILGINRGTLRKKIKQYGL